MALSGVRISWFMLAMKADLSRLALSAFSLSCCSSSMMACQVLSSRQNPTSFSTCPAESNSAAAPIR